MRFRELGVRVVDGVLHLEPGRVFEEDWLTGPASLDVMATEGGLRTLALGPGELGFTLCGVPIVYRRQASGVSITLADGGQEHREAGLDSATSARIFARDGHVRQISVGLPADPHGRGPEARTASLPAGPTLHTAEGSEVA